MCCSNHTRDARMITPPAFWLLLILSAQFHDGVLDWPNVGVCHAGVYFGETDCFEHGTRWITKSQENKGQIDVVQCVPLPDLGEHQITIFGTARSIPLKKIRHCSE